MSIVSIDDGTTKKHVAVPDDSVQQLKDSMAKAQEKTGAKAMKLEVVASGLSQADAQKKVAELNGKSEPATPTDKADPADETDPAGAT